jgi:cupin fold WbuC family metalloprotein
LNNLFFSSLNETLPGVFHTKAWEQDIPEDFMNQLIEKARTNPNRKARLCLHPNPNELLQITYLAFCSPYSDRIHCHPHRPEVLVPIIGQAKHTTYNRAAQKISSKIIDGSFPVPIATPKGVWHAIEALTPSFVMIEVGTGPFLRDSTVFLQAPEL